MIQDIETTPSINPRSFQSKHFNISKYTPLFISLIGMGAIVIGSLILGGIGIYNISNFDAFNTIVIGSIMVLSGFLFFASKKQECSSVSAIKNKQTELNAVPLEMYQTICTYVNCCCFALSKKQFEEILDDDVQLYHQTNEESPFIAQGKKAVFELFCKYVFDNSSDIKLKEMNIKAQENAQGKISLRLLVEETKTTKGILNGRFLFDEHTNFQFNDKALHKIISIRMQVKRQLII